MKTRSGLMCLAIALMEYHSTKTSDVSTKIFELGMKQYASDVDFIVRYLAFLISTNDDTSEWFHILAGRIGTEYSTLF